MPTPEELRQEADEATRQFSIELGRREQGSGIRPPPKIEVSEITLDPQPMNIGLDRGTDIARGELPGGGGGGGGDPIGACCDDENACTETTETECVGTWQPGDCDPNPCGECPCAVNVTFHNVLFDCGCFDIGGGNSQIDSDDSTFNEITFTLYRTNPDDVFCPEAQCAFEGPGIFDRVPGGCLVTNWFTNTTCSGPPSNSLHSDSSVYLYKISGTWYLSEEGAFAFYGEALDFSTDFVNEASCGLTNWDTPYFDCEFGGPITILNEGGGGSATVEIATGVCGACCYDGICDDFPEAHCDEVSGVYHGDGTTCATEVC